MSLSLINFWDMYSLTGWEGVEIPGLPFLVLCLICCSWLQKNNSLAFLCRICCSSRWKWIELRYREFHRGPHLKSRILAMSKCTLPLIFSVHFPVFKDMWIRVVSFAVCCLAFCLPSLSVELQSFVKVICVLSRKCPVRSPNHFVESLSQGIGWTIKVANIGLSRHLWWSVNGKQTDEKEN